MEPKHTSISDNTHSEHPYKTCPQCGEPLMEFHLVDYDWWQYPKDHQHYPSGFKLGGRHLHGSCANGHVWCLNEIAGKYCHKECPGCFCAVGWPYQKQCPDCRDSWKPEEFRNSYCICPPPEEYDGIYKREQQVDNV